MITSRKCREALSRHVRFIGPGLVAAVAYIDPGNWATDLQAGANYGYKLLFIVFVAGLAAVVLQTLSVRLGTTTSTSLPYQTRQLFLRLELKYPRWRVPLHCCLWALYILAEIAIIGTDLAELIGSAVALNLLFPALPLWAGVIITAADVLLVLAFFNSNSGRRGMLFFEILIVTLVLAVFVSFAILLHLIKPEWKEVFFGLLPSSTLVAPGATYVSIGIIGATVMPHALFLGSSLASVDRLDMLPRPPKRPEERSYSVKLPSILRSRLPFRSRNATSGRKSDEVDRDVQGIELGTVPIPSLTGLAGPAVRPPPSAPGLEPDAGMGNVEAERDVKALSPVVPSESRDSVEDARQGEYDKALQVYEGEMRRFDRIRWVDLHLKHATVDTAMSLLGFALTINASILTLAGAAFYYSTTGADPDDATLQGAHALLSDYIGYGAGLIFALALLCAGQSASITATLAGQVVSEGFINWRTSPFWRRLITRLIGVIPAATVAAAVGPAGLNTMLVASQVLLSIVLPTVIFPLVYLCSREDIMTVRGIEKEAPVSASSPTPTPAPDASSDVPEPPDARPASLAPLTSTSGPAVAVPPQGVAQTERETRSFRSPVWITVLGYALFAVVVLANCYVIVQLALGND